MVQGEVKKVNLSFEKKFNVGLTLDTNVKEFTTFLKDYGKYIYSFFFSLPLGSAFQTRNAVNRQFAFKKKEKLFWQMLNAIKEHDIRLELLFNTATLAEEDIIASKNLLEERGVKIDSVCFLLAHYQAVAKHFPDCEYVFSYNNGDICKTQFEKIISTTKVDTFVIGGAYIRDNAFFKQVKESGKKIIHLINNGCSFHCATCPIGGRKACKALFDKNRKTHSVEYLYALQSVFPCELRDGTIECEYIDLFKISNRSSNIKYTKGVIDSYVSGKVKKYVRFNKFNYAYWGRLGHFWNYFPFMRLKKIIAFKKEILGHDINVE